MMRKQEEVFSFRCENNGDKPINQPNFMPLLFPEFRACDHQFPLTGQVTHFFASYVSGECLEL